MKVKRLVDWVGQYLCQTIEKLIHKVLVNKPNEKRSRSRPRQRWFDRIDKDLENLKTTITEDAYVWRIWEELS